MENEGRTIALRAFCRVYPDSKGCEYVGRRTKCGKYHNFSLMMTNEKHIYDIDNLLFKICSKCGKKKSVNEFSDNVGIADGKRKICNQCYKDMSREWVAQKKKKGIKITSSCSEETKENNRMRVLRDYYDSNKQYLLKKYLKRHEIQLEDWTEREKVLYTELSQAKDYNEKKRIIRTLTTAKLKIEHLQEKIREETKELNNNNTSISQ